MTTYKTQDRRADGRPTPTNAVRNGHPSATRGREANARPEGRVSQHEEQEPVRETAKRTGACLAVATIVGNLGADPETRYTQQGRTVSHFRVAVNRARKTTDDAWQEHTDWFSVSAFGPLADRASERLSKGSRVLVQGRLSARTWETPDGETRVFLDVLASELVVLDRVGSNGAETSTEPHERANETDDDLPF